MSPTRTKGATAESDPDLDAAVDAAGALDLMLIVAALGPLRRLLPGAPGLRLAQKLLTRPHRLAGRLGELAGELGRVGLGQSELAPTKGDRRFTDTAWTDNPLLRRMMQAYLATGSAVDSIIGDAELDWRDDEQVRFAVTNLIDALSPSNNPMISPVAWKALIDSGGENVARGLAAFVKDMTSAPRIPTMVDTSAFEVGRTVATTSGAVVLRTPMFELIQYAPQTAKVHQTPLVIVPPVINKYYVIDLAPGRSMVEFLVSEGMQVFVVSWRNPDARHRQWGMDAYGEAIVTAIDTVNDIAGTDSTNVLGLCSGGILLSMVLSHLAAEDALDKVSTLALGVTVLDQARAGMASAALSERLAKTAIAASARRGYLDGRSLAEMFAWLRPNDLIWNYWINNYLQGKKPPAFDVLYWNADTTRMTAHLHRDFIELALTNSLVTPGEATMLGTPVDLSAVELDSYVVAGIADHICPWQSCYATTQLLGGNTRFVLSTAGHIASLVNPPDNPKSTFRTHTDNPASAEEWIAEATTTRGSWWPDLAGWLAKRSGPMVKAPANPGSTAHPPAEPAPGTYVFDR